MDEKAVISFYNACLDECRDATSGIRKTWEKNLAFYLCERDTSKKKDWQFRITTPICKPKTKRAVNLIKTTLLRAGDYLDFDSPQRSETDPLYKQDILRCNYTKRLVKSHMDARPCSFIENFSESLEAAFGWSGLMVLKFWVSYVDSGYFDMPRNEYVKTEKLVLRSKAVDPFLFDFTADGRIQIEHQYVTMPELWSGVEKGDFDEKIVRKLVTNDYGDHTKLKDEEKVRLKRLGLNETHNEYRQEVCLSHFWGPIYQKDGRTNKIKIIKDHGRFTMANGKYLLTEIEDNPYPDKSTPYVYDSILKVPFRHLGKSLTEDVNNIEKAINDLVEIQADNGLWQLLGVTELDQMSLTAQDKWAFKELYPGVPIIRRPGSTELAFKRHEMGTDPSKAMPLLQELKMFHDADHGVSEALAGDPSFVQAGDEENQRRNDALSQFEGFATSLERGIFTQCIDRARDRIIQYLSGERNPNAESILGIEGQELDRMSTEERKALIVSEYDIVPKGISIFFERMRKANSYTGVYKLANGLPPEGQEVIKWESFVPKIFETTAIDCPQDFVRTPDELQARAKQKAEQQQMMMEMEMKKIMLPYQTKVEQTKLGVQERMTMGREKMQAELQKELLKLESQAEDSKTRAALETARLFLQAQMHKDKTDLGKANLMLNKQDKDHTHMLDAAKLMLEDQDMTHQHTIAKKQLEKQGAAKNARD